MSGKEMEPGTGTCKRLANWVDLAGGTVDSTPEAGKQKGLQPEELLWLL